MRVKGSGNAFSDDRVTWARAVEPAVGGRAAVVAHQEVVVGEDRDPLGEVAEGEVVAGLDQVGEGDRAVDHWAAAADAEAVAG